MYPPGLRSDHCTGGNAFTEPEQRKDAKNVISSKWEQIVGSHWLMEGISYNFYWFQKHRMGAFPAFLSRKREKPTLTTGMLQVHEVQNSIWFASQEEAKPGAILCPPHWAPQWPGVCIRLAVSYPLWALTYQHCQSSRSPKLFPSSPTTHIVCLQVWPLTWPLVKPHRLRQGANSEVSPQT